jgi:hypothetical protein
MLSEGQEDANSERVKAALRLQFPLHCRNVTGTVTKHKGSVNVITIRD